MNAKIRIVVAGIAGRMGREVARVALESEEFAVAGGLESRDHPHWGATLRALGLASDAPIAGELDALPLEPGGAPGVLVEFALAGGALEHARAAGDRGWGVVSGSTGLSAAEEGALRTVASRVPVVRSPNFSRGALALLRFAPYLAGELGSGFDVEIVESHHRGKRDVPSGTALALAERLRAARGAQAGVTVGRGRGQSPRVPGEIGVHGVRGGSIPGEHRLILAGDGETLEIVHRVFGREAFARGALLAARWIAGKAPGMYQGLEALASPGAGEEAGS